MCEPSTLKAFKIFSAVPGTSHAWVKCKSTLDRIFQSSPETYHKTMEKKSLWRILLHQFCLVEQFTLFLYK